MAGGTVQVVECLPSKNEGLSSNPRAVKNKKLEKYKQIHKISGSITQIHNDKKCDLARSSAKRARNVIYFHKKK
jgi:hypothetical protein